MNYKFTVSPLLKEYELRHNPVVITVHEFNNKAAKEFTQKMAMANNTGQKVIPIIIDSYGGEVYSLMSMISDIQQASIPVATIAKGKAMSCGAVLLTFGADGLRFMDPHATVMIHDVSSGMIGKVEDLKVGAAECDRLNDKIFTMMARNCNQADDFFIEKLKENHRADWYLEAEECLEHNIVQHLRVPKINVKIDVKIDIK